jgi:hypothetical protein
MIVPCKDCNKRTRPKTCENDCPLWAEYKEYKKIESQTIKQNKRLHYRLNRAIWRNAQSTK